MIVVIAWLEENDRTGVRSILVSHGIDMDTGNVVNLPSLPPESIGAVFDSDIGEYVLYD